MPYNESYRLVVRTKGQDKSAYWDSKHTAGTYTYHRITGVPWPAARAGAGTRSARRPPRRCPAPAAARRDAGRCHAGAEQLGRLRAPRRGRAGSYPARA